MLVHGRLIKYLLSMFEGFDVKSKCGFYSINIFSIKLLQNCCFPSVIKTSEKRS